MPAELSTSESDRRVQVARIEPATRAEGPGVRWAVWVQGCSIGCAGCCNPHTWEKSGGYTVAVSELIRQAAAAPVEGITLLGGEPFDQANALADLATAARAEGRGVMTLTGYRFEVLRRGSQPGWAELLAATDLLVDGPYLEAQRDLVRPWVGSRNQRFIHLSGRYRTALGMSQRDRVELRIRRDGAVAVNGWPDAELVTALECLIDDL